MNGKWMGIKLHQFGFLLTGTDQRKTNLIRKEREAGPDLSGKANQL